MWAPFENEHHRPEAPSIKHFSSMQMFPVIGFFLWPYTYRWNSGIADSSTVQV
jgi:hypothetical protein